MYAVIMAGGRGTRFWPESREALPKQFLAMTAEKTMLQQTVDRLLPLVPLKNILIVTGDIYGEETFRQLPRLPKENVIMEPRGRNTAPCIGLAALYVKSKDPAAVMVVLPADHVVENDRAFLDTIGRASLAALHRESLVTIGIMPQSPETGYGYIERGEPCEAEHEKDLFRVASFREKPDLATARSFLERGSFLWNSGIFVWTVSSILHAIKEHLPDLHRELLSVEECLGTPAEAASIHAAYERINPVSIDYGVMEKADNVLLIRGDFGWNDLGSWDALADLLQKDGDGKARRGPTITVETKNSLVLGGGKLISLVGVENLLVVETGDAILIMKRGRSQDVRKVVEQLERNNMKEYL